MSLVLRSSCDFFRGCSSEEAKRVYQHLHLDGSLPLDLFLAFLIFLFIFREGKGGSKGERSINVWLPLTRHLLGTWPETQACALTGNRTGDPLVHRPVLSPLSRTSQGQFFMFNTKPSCVVKSIRFSRRTYQIIPQSKATPLS